MITISEEAQAHFVKLLSQISKYVGLADDNYIRRSPGSLRKTVE